MKKNNYIFLLSLLISIFMIHNIYGSTSMPPIPKSEDIKLKDPILNNFKIEKKSKEIEKKQEILQKLSLDASIDKITFENKMEKLRREIEELKLKEELKKLRLEAEFLEEKIKFQKKLMETKKQTEEAKLETELIKVKLEKAQQKLQTVLSKKKHETEISSAETNHLKAKIEELKSKNDKNRFVDSKPKYLQNPLKENGTLVISDRRIGLDGVISTVKANYIIEMINFYNLKDSKLPIFLVINVSPGGYLRSGIRIIKAIETSKAPIYVVVKEYAASMTAAIVTCAKRSYAFPYSQIIHHQPSSLFYGNTKEKSYQFRLAEERALRFLGMIVEKMNLRMSNSVKRRLGGKLTVTKFIDKLYEDGRTGDWIAFAGKSNIKETTIFKGETKLEPLLSAKELGWVTNIIHSVEETSVTEIPNQSNYTWKKFYTKYYDLEPGVSQIVKSQDGKTKIKLPPAQFGDSYFIYNDGSFIFQD